MNFIAKFILALTIFVVVAGATVVGTFWYLTESPNIEVPDLKGKSLSEAASVLSAHSLFIKKIGDNYDSSVPEDFILSQNPAAGSLIKRNRTIHVYLSKGPQIEYMPDFKGLALDDAKEKAAHTGVSISKLINVHSHTIEEGIVIAQRPAPDEKGGKDLTLVVSMGQYYTMGITPDLRGVNIEVAKRIAKNSALRLDIHGDGMYVSSQSPVPGTKIMAGDKIRVFLKKIR